MIRHIVMWKFRPGTEKEQEQFLYSLRALQGVIPQLVSCEVGWNVNDGEYAAALISLFGTLAHIQPNKHDPRHQAVSALCKSIRLSRAAVDYEIL